MDIMRTIKSLLYQIYTKETSNKTFHQTYYYYNEEKKIS